MGRITYNYHCTMDVGSDTLTCDLLIDKESMDISILNGDGTEKEFVRLDKGQVKVLIEDLLSKYEEMTDDDR